MKTYINKYYILLLLCSLGLIASCKKYINEGPIDSPTNDNFWVSERAAESGLAGAYGLLRTALTNSRACFVFGDATASEFLFNQNNWTLQSLQPDNNFNFDYEPYEEELVDWTPFYKAISQCNLILSKVPAIPASGFTDDPVATKNQILGEAYFVRAYCYYYLSQVWGQPVIVTQAYTDPINAQPIARSTTAAGFAQAASDLMASIKLLPYGYSNPANTAVQANRGAAFALLAKTYLWQKQYQLASAAADSVILHGGYTLEPGATYSNIFKGHDQESIFEINMLYSPNQNEAQNGEYDPTTGQTGVFAQFLAEPFIAGKDPQGIWNVNLNLVNHLYDTTAAGRAKDVRINATFYGLQSVVTQMVKYANVIYQQPAQQTQPFVSNNMVLLRLADTYLVKAEADVNLGNTGNAALYLNKVRLRAGLGHTASTDPKQMMYLIMDERGREFFGEGTWYFDLYRTGLIFDAGYDTAIDGYLPARAGNDNAGFQWPLDLRTLLPQDPLLTQNPYWALASQN
jgi:hypothetical protein